MFRPVKDKSERRAARAPVKRHRDGNGALGRARGVDVAAPLRPRRRRTSGRDRLTDSFAFFRYGDVSSFTAVVVQSCRRAVVPCQLVD